MYSQPTFEPPRMLIISLANHASLMMVPRAVAIFNSSPTVKLKLLNPPLSPTHTDSPKSTVTTLSNDSSDDIVNQLMKQLIHEVNLLSSYEVMTNPTLTPVNHAE
jgi:hypothetical protein